MSIGQKQWEELAITGITRGAVDFTRPPAKPEYPYGVAFPFQVAPKLAGVFCNIRVAGLPWWDHEFGTDIILFDDLAQTKAKQTLALSRNQVVSNPSGGQKRYHMKLPAFGGFVPFGAKHPHAGTGFAFCRVIDFPHHEQKCYDWSDSWLDCIELYQIAYDGKTMCTGKTELATAEKPIRVGNTEWVLIEPGMNNAIPDGDDLLMAIVVKAKSSTVTGVGRWQYRQGEWKLASFLPVTTPSRTIFDQVINESAKPDYWAEPSLIRDVDGSLIFGCRCNGEKISKLTRLWRSRDGGKSWEILFDAHDIRRDGPITLCQAADGTPYVAANFPRIGRDILCLWVLNKARTGIAGMVVARDLGDEWGEPPEAAQWYADQKNGVPPPRTDVPNRPNRWWADHPSSAVLQLADGKWHGVLCYRVMTDWQLHHSALPTPETGAYVEEVFSRGPAVPAWKF